LRSLLVQVKIDNYCQNPRQNTKKRS